MICQLHQILKTFIQNYDDSILRMYGYKRNSNFVEIDHMLSDVLVSIYSSKQTYTLRVLQPVLHPIVKRVIFCGLTYIYLHCCHRSTSVDAIFFV